MKKRLFALGLLSGAILAPRLASAEGAAFEVTDGWKLKFSGQYRPRLWVGTEGTLLFNPPFDLREDQVHGLVNQRARLTTSLTSENGMEFTLSLQDVRAWGEESDTLNDYSAKGFDAHQAFALLPLSDQLGLKLGRQEIVLDNQRLVGNVDWTQRGRSFDGARLLYKEGDLEAGLLYARIRSRLEGGFTDAHVDAVGAAKVMSAGATPTEVTALTAVEPAADIDLPGLHVAMNFKQDADHQDRIALLYLLKATTDTNGDAADQTLHTFGGIANGLHKGISYTGEFYYQAGAMNVGPAPGDKDHEVAAMLGAGRVGYVAPVDMKPGLTLWGEWLSGDGKPWNAFDTLYATNHKFYGYMDYFVNVPRDTNYHGLLDAGAGVQAAFTSAFTGTVDFHHFRTSMAIEYADIAEQPKESQTLGNEVDLMLNYAFNAVVGLNLKWGVFLPEKGFAYLNSQRQKGPMPYAGEGLKTQSLGYLTLDVKL